MAADARDQLAAGETEVSWWVDVDPVAFASWLGAFLVIGVAARRLAGGPGGGPPARRRWG